MPDSIAASAKIVLVSDYDYAFTGTTYRKDIASSTYVHSYDVTICGKTPDVSLTFTILGNPIWGLLDRPPLRISLCVFLRVPPISI